MASQSISTRASGGHTSRRSFLAAVPIATAAVAVPAAAVAIPGTSADAEIIAAWDRRQAAWAGYHALPLDAEPAVEEPYWSAIDAAEEEIRSRVARTPRGVSIQLWVALDHRQFDREQSRLIQGADLEALLAKDRDLDWDLRVTLAALRSLRSMGA